jgi:hypothetical protein
VICGNKARFEAYTGGAHDAAFVVEADTFARHEYDDMSARSEPFDLSPTDGYLWLSAHEGGQADWDVVKWCDTPGSSGVTLHTDIAGASWTGNEFDSSTLSAGDSMRRDPTGTDTHTAADWAAESAPKPGGVYDVDDDEWLTVELDRTHPTLPDGSTAGDTSITMTSTVGFPDKTGETYSGIIESDDFTYTGRTATTLTGIPAAGAGSLGSDHAADTTVYPYYDSTTQVGWRLSRLEIKRREGLSTIKRGRVFVSHLAASGLRTPDEAGFTADWDGPMYIQNDEGRAVLPFMLAHRTYPWIKTFLIIIDEMSDGGRAKVNEIEVTADQASINVSGLADITAKSGDLAAYLVGESSWLTTADVTDNTDRTLADSSTEEWGFLGSVQTAIRSLPAVLDDIARQTGCLCRYRLDGGINWARNPWWIGGLGNDGEPYVTWVPSYVRGDIRFRKRSATSGGVRVDAMLADGTPLQSMVYPPNASGTTLLQRSGYTVSHEGQLWDLSHAVYHDEVVPHTVSLTVKGVGEWCRAGQWHNIDWDGDEDQTYVVDSVTWAWGTTGDGFKTWRCGLELTRYG